MYTRSPARSGAAPAMPGLPAGADMSQMMAMMFAMGQSMAKGGSAAMDPSAFMKAFQQVRYPCDVMLSLDTHAIRMAIFSGIFYWLRVNISA